MRVTLPIRSDDEARALLGLQDRNARLLRDTFQVAVTFRNGTLQLEGDEAQVAAALRVAEETLKRFRAEGQVGETEVATLIRSAALSAPPAPGVPVPPPPEALVKTRGGRNVAPRTPGQKRYVEAMGRTDVVFAIGPAGTGKTYLAVCMAVRVLREGLVKRLILTRPAVEAGEKLGFLPGTFEAKVNPYLRPLYDALYDLVDPAQVRKYAEHDVIEVAPLAYMRGRTLSDAFVILDEAQNTTPGQMKMFLTRMGEGSRVVVTGDITQIDLPHATTSGLVHASRVLQGVKGVSFCEFGQRDIVRHPVVQRIVDAYEKNDA